jgi:SSS family solute:Na+ symporter
VVAEPSKTPAGWASIAVGAGVSLFGLVFCHAAEAKALGICKLLTGRDVLIAAHPWPVVDTLCYALPLSLVTLIVVSLLTKAPAPEHIERCFRRH